MPAKALVVLAPGFEEIEAVTPIDVLRRAGVEVVVAGVGATRVTGSHDITIDCDVAISAVDATPDAIVLPGGLPGASNLGESEAVRRLVLAVHERGGICAAICAAPAYTLAPFGLLEGRKATCYPSFEARFDAATLHSEDEVVVDGNIVTSRGPGTALAFSLTLAGLLADPDVAGELRARMLAPG